MNEIPLSKTTSFIVDNRGKTAPTSDTGIPLIATNCISNDDLYPAYKNVRYVSEDTYENWFRSHPIPGDIILTLKGSQNGAVCLVPDPVDFVIAQDMVALRPNNKIIDPLFLFAALRSPQIQHQIKALDVSGVIPHLKKSDFDKLILPYPKIQVQREIGKTYFLLSKKITLLQRQNQTLEKIAQILFKHWFIDFEFPNAEGKPYRSSGGAMEASEFGEVPVGWHIDSMLEFCDLLSGGTPKTSIPEYWDGKIKWLSAKDVAGNSGVFILDSEKKITTDGLNESSTKLLPKNSTVITARGTVGCFSMISEEMCISQSNYGLKARRANQDYFTYLLVGHLISRMQANAYGSVFDTITTTTFKELQVIFPGDDIIAVFEELVRPLFGKILNNGNEIFTLTSVRDTLLPKLMSGQIRIKDVEKELT